MRTQLDDLKQELREVEWIMRQYDVNGMPYDETYKELDNKAMDIRSTINNIR